MYWEKKQVIANEIKDAKYFSVIVDSTPDLSHTDQLTIIFRFVNFKGNVLERFIAFEPISCHTGESLCDYLIKMVNNLGGDCLCKTSVLWSPKCFDCFLICCYAVAR